MLKLCPYPRNMRYSIVEGPANAKWKARLDGWLANTKHIYLREYYFCGCIFYPRPIADSAAVDLRSWAAIMHTESYNSQNCRFRIALEL